MGMHDTINGEQVKCFSWMSYGEDGRVANSFKNKIDKINWSNNKSVINYNGDLLYKFL